MASWIRFWGAAAVLALFGSAFGLAVWMIAHEDLQAMQTGTIDPEGKWETKFGRDRAINGFVLGICSFLLWGPMTLLICLHY